MKGYDQMIEDASGITQSTLGYANGGFGYGDLQALQRELANRSSDVMLIHCNSATKSKLISMIPDKSYRKANNANEANKAGIYYDGIVATEWDGRVLNFIVDNSIASSEFAVLDMNSIGLTPRKDKSGTDKMYQVNPENVTSAKIEEVIRTVCTLKIQYPTMMATLKNI